MKCRHCSIALSHTFLDLGFAPPSNAYLSAQDLVRPEVYYPLKVKVCVECWLVQTEDYAEAGELFTPDYAYFSSTSKMWLEHASLYAQRMIEKLRLDSNSLVVEIASNDGYLLKNFVAAAVPCLGIEPTTRTANAAEKLGVPVLQEFFCEELGLRLAKEGRQADLITGNNVYAHVPDINDFTRGLKALLKPEGVITLEFPHIMRLLESYQFDTVYHEHFSYLSLHTVSKILSAAGLRVWHVEELSTHGGSLRVHACHEGAQRDTSSSVTAMLIEETDRGLQKSETYTEFQPYADKIKNDLIAFLLEQKERGLSVVAYGAAAKGNTLLNYAGVKPDLLPCVYDAAASKQHKYMPGSHIPILPATEISRTRPDFVLILPWNIAEEVRQQNQKLVASGTRFVTAVPKLSIS